MGGDIGGDMGGDMEGDMEETWARYKRHRRISGPHLDTLCGEDAKGAVVDEGLPALAQHHPLPTVRRRGQDGQEDKGQEEDRMREGQKEYGI